MKVGHVFKRVLVEILPKESIVPECIPTLADVADDQDVGDEDNVKAEVNVKAIEVAGSPLRLEDLRADGVARSPTNN